MSRSSGGAVEMATGAAEGGRGEGQEVQGASGNGKREADAEVLSSVEAQRRLKRQARWAN